MNLIQAIVKLLCKTKMYIAFPKIIEQILNLMMDGSIEITENLIFEILGRTTTETFGQIPYMINESDGYVLIKNITTKQWDVIKLPSEINLDIYQIYGKFGNTHAIRSLHPEEIIAITMAKVSEKRIYISNSADVILDSKPRSIVYENIINEDIDITTKNVNLTFFNCKYLNINLQECPVGGIKMVKCNYCNITLYNCDKSPVVPIYAFYCADCNVVLLHNYTGKIDKEIHECVNFCIFPPCP